jgi:hypothetical protein
MNEQQCPKCGKPYESRSVYPDWGNGKPAVMFVHESHIVMGMFRHVDKSCLLRGEEAEAYIAKLDEGSEQ